MKGTCARCHKPKTLTTATRLCVPCYYARRREITQEAEAHAAEVEAETAEYARRVREEAGV